MRLYHFTSIGRIQRIIADGRLTVVESNLSRTREHAGPDVVWLTSNPDPAAHNWKTATVIDKTAVRFTVDIPKRDVHRWRPWAKRRGIDPRWMRTLAESGGSGSWYVVERPIPRTEWIEIVDTVTGDPIGSDVLPARSDKET